MNRWEKKKMNSFKVLLNKLSDTVPRWKVPFHDRTDSHGLSCRPHLTRGDAPWSFSSVSHSSPIPGMYFLGSSGLWNKQPPHAELCRHSSPSSWLLRDGPCIPIRGPDAFIPAGGAAVHQPAPATSLPASLSSSLLPCQGFSNFLNWTRLPGLSCVPGYPCTALAHGQGPQAWARSV